MNTSTNADTTIFVTGITVIATKGKHEGKFGEITSMTAKQATVTTEQGEVFKIAFTAITHYEPAPTGKRTQAATLKQYRVGYRVSVTGTGRKSQASPLSAVATHWEGNDHGAVAQWAAILLGKPTLELYEKYAHLNNGQMRMNAGNMVNARVKKGELTHQELVDVMTAVDCKITPTAELDAQHRPDRIAK
jgi:hypothetical protein